MPGRSNDKRFSILQRCAADFFDRARITEVDRNIAILDRWLDRVAEIALRDDLDLRVVPGKIDNRLAHSTARSDERHAHRGFHFASSNASSVFRSRVCFSSVISPNSTPTSPDFPPPHPPALLPPPHST